jgi:hypothetical protein
MNADLVLQCCQCRAVLAGTEYVPASPVPWAKVSHGYCRPCADAARLALDRLRLAEQPAPIAQREAA